MENIEKAVASSERKSVVHHIDDLIAQAMKFTKCKAPIALDIYDSFPIAKYVGQRLKMIDQQFITVSQEYSNIHDALENLSTEVNKIGGSRSELSATIRQVLK